MPERNEEGLLLPVASAVRAPAFGNHGSLVWLGGGLVALGGGRPLALVAAGCDRVDGPSELGRLFSDNMGASERLRGSAATASTFVPVSCEDDAAEEVSVEVVAE